MPEESKPRLDEFTAKVVSDPSQPQQTLLLQGFLGASSEPDHTRIYSDVTLESYVDVANADIIHSVTLPKEQSPLGGSYVWIKRAAEAFAGTPGPARAKAQFLEGPIAAEASAQPAAPAPQPQPLPHTVPLLACHPTIVFRACPPPPSRFFCVTQPLFCHPTLACPTNPVVCLAATGSGGCYIPDPTIYEQGTQYQAPQYQAQAAAMAPPLPPSQLPQQCITHPTVCACPSLSAAICPTHGGTFCPTPQCPTPQHHCPTPLCPTPQHHCPTPQCPTPQNQCPSVAGFQCPTVNQFHCPSVLGFQCPSVAGFHCPTVQGYHCPTVHNHHCPSVNNYHCPPSDVCTDIGPHCNPTPNPVHCPTPNQMCPPHTSSFSCPSVGEICATSSELFC